MNIHRRGLLIALLFFGLALPASAANARGEWMNRLKILGLALHNYHAFDWRKRRGGAGCSRATCCYWRWRPWMPRRPIRIVDPNTHW